MGEIKNKKEKTTSSRDLTEENIINDLLISEKDISNNYSTALNEMSNKVLYKKVQTLLIASKNAARELYNLAFEKGWYAVTPATETEISKALTDAEKKLNELS